MPIVRLSLAAKSMRAGEEVVVEATDPAFEMDVAAWSEMTGHELREIQGGEILRARIRIAHDGSSADPA